MVNCIFCKILTGEIPAHFLYMDEHHVAFLDRFPINRGHCLVIPVIHHELVTDMPPQTVGQLFEVVPRIARAVLQATNADGFSLGQNNGEAADQIVPHVHVHIIPRYSKTDTDWKKREIVEDDDLAPLAQKIRDILNVSV